MDQLGIYFSASHSEAFQVAAVKRRGDRLKIHHTPRFSYWPTFPRDHRRSNGDPAELGENVAAIGFERFLLAMRHQVDVELVDPDRLQLA
jgi:hypothetical protein